MDERSVAARLIAWHAEHQRDLPWRTAPAGSRDPYEVWVSEIMAQQTRVDTVVDYYVAWMARFPTLAHLAAADQQDVLKQWEGLGYYARARNLHRAAQQVMAEHGGEIPADRRALLALPGIGPYTAGAILSLAFNQPQPILDGNVKRVLSRLADIDRPIDEPPVVKELWRLAASIVDAAEPGAAGACNEALMELGALICTPAHPRCLICPLHATTETPAANALCLAAERGLQGERPIMPKRKPTPHYDVAAGVIWQDAPYESRLLIAQRAQDGMLGGLWEFPGGKLEASDADLAACLRREIDEELGFSIQVGAPLVTVEHAFTHFRITLHAFHARHAAGEPRAIDCADWRWVALDELDAFPFPVTDQKIIAALRQGAAQG
jgi:A/G-specific adenine glycosylase